MNTAKKSFFERSYSRSARRNPSRVKVSKPNHAFDRHSRRVKAEILDRAAEKFVEYA